MIVLLDVAVLRVPSTLEIKNKTCCIGLKHQEERVNDSFSRKSWPVMMAVHNLCHAKG